MNTDWKPDPYPYTQGDGPVMRIVSWLLVAALAAGVGFICVVGTFGMGSLP